MKTEPTTSLPSENQLSDNELIAEFMGWERDNKNCPVEYTTWCKVGFMPIPYHWLEKYQTSWEWLMPVVGKVNEAVLGRFIPWADVQYSLREENITVVYNRVVTAIKWYNANQPKP